MSEGFNFKQLKAEILARSRASDWEVAKNEWRLVAVSEADEPETCLCGHFPIIELCTISNSINGASVDVGNVCVKRFLGLRSDQIFITLKKIRNDMSASVGEAAMIFFHERGVINDWEYNFLSSNFRRRNFSKKQLDIRRGINEKIIRSVARRGIS